MHAAFHHFAQTCKAFNGRFSNPLIAVDDLARTPAQRRADALWQIFQDAAATPPGSNAPRFVHNIVWDAASYQQMLAELDGRPRRALDVDTFRCSTIEVWRSPLPRRSSTA